MQYSQRRETISMPPRPPLLACPPFASEEGDEAAAASWDWREPMAAQGGGGEAGLDTNPFFLGPQEDETLGMLQQLEQMTVHAWTLQRKLYLQQLRNLRSPLSCHTTLRLGGEGQLLAELKLANMLLRRELAARNKTIRQQQVTIQALREQLRSVSEEDGGK
eukprot:gene40345-49166_t